MKQISVKAGDVVRVSANVLDNTPYKKRFWNNVLKAVVPAFIISNVAQQKVANVSERQAGNVPSVAVNLAVAPGAIALAAPTGKSKTYVGLTAYDTDGQRVATATDAMTKAARKDWEELSVGYQVEKDGYFEVLGDKDKAKQVVALTNEPSNWINVSVKSADGPVSPGTDTLGVGTSDSFCTRWYWCGQGSQGVSCTYLYTECYFDEGPTLDENGNPTGSDGGYRAEKKGCAECKANAQREYDKSLAFAKATLYTAVAVSGTAGVVTYLEFNTAGWWVNLIPGIGPGAIQLLSVLGGLTVGIDGVVLAVYAYQAAEAAIENNLYKDKLNCEQVFTDCGN